MSSTKNTMRYVLKVSGCGLTAPRKDPFKTRRKPHTSIDGDKWTSNRINIVSSSRTTHSHRAYNNRDKGVKTCYTPPVSYTHLTLPTNREV